MESDKQFEGLWSVEQMMSVGWTRKEAEAKITKDIDIALHWDAIDRLEREFGKVSNQTETPVIYNEILTYEERRAILLGIRADKAAKRTARETKRVVKPATKGKLIPFEHRVTSADAYHARALGIRL